MNASSYWEEKFAQCDAFWRHDGNRKRPYARLTSGLISDGFFNGGRVIENDPVTFGIACTTLWERAAIVNLTDRVTRVVGAAVGAISLASRIAEAGSVRSGFAEKDHEGFSFLRPQMDERERLLLVEDTITTGKTLEDLRNAARSAVTHCEFAPVILALCNRTGNTTLNGVPISALIAPSFRTWKRGENPYTPDGAELVEPVRPKTHWKELTQEYD